MLKSAIRGVKEVYQRSFQSGIAKLDVEIRSATDVLADELASKQFQGMTLEITGMTGDRIDITVSQ